MNIVEISIFDLYHFEDDKRNYDLTIQDEFQLDDGIISESFNNIFDMDIVATIILSSVSDGSVVISNLVQDIVLRVLNKHHGNVPICINDSKQLLENNSFFMNHQLY
ncbi:unnamed protein product [Rotaria sp. Silwood1]|nr:unnamed protein product [Rotaria sp. Silwood1]CAF5108862.1 unnamed protein product [Rotaria sp. Silwood1]